MKRYKHLFFDLDRTLWDFERNSRAALKNIFNMYNLHEKIDDFDSFINRYTIHNDRLWVAYNKGQLKKTELRITRFKNTLKDFGIKDIELVKIINNQYIKTSPRGKLLIPNTTEVLNYLKEKYQLYVITNGFKEVQYLKLENTGIINYFEKIFTSDEIGFTKPDKKFFSRALNSVNAKKKECLVIGDDLKMDIIGAREYGIDQVFFNSKLIPHKEKVTYEISNLKELTKFL